MEFSGEHLAYELEMFFATAVEQMFPDGKMSGNVKNALLESFLVHARSLLFFFYPGAVQPDDAFAQHFMKSDIIWAVVRPNLSPALRRVQKRVGKEVAHLTYHRGQIAMDEKGWNFGQIILDFVPIFQAFAQVSDAQKLHHHFLEVGNFWMDVLVRRGLFSVNVAQQSVGEVGKI